MVRHSAEIPFAGTGTGVRWFTLATLAISAAGALVSPQVTADAAVLRPGIASLTGTGDGEGGGGSEGGTGTGSAFNTSGGSPAQQAAITVNGLSTFQAAVCNQQMQVCNINQQLWNQWGP